MLKRALTGIPVLALLVGLAACGEDDTTWTASDDSGDDSAAETPAGDGPACSYPTDGTDAGAEPPPSTAELSGRVPAVLETSVGDIAVDLDADNAPCTVNSFVSLAEQGYFDGTSCHRLTTAGIYVLQCGDPTGTGSGGPGYSFEDELTGEETYGAGTLAMANAGPNTNGSQFFIVYDDSQLPPSYTVFGEVDEAGVKTVADVAKDGSTPQMDGAPNTPVEIEGVTVG